MVESDGTSLPNKRLREQMEQLNQQFQPEYVINHYLAQAERLAGGREPQDVNPDVRDMIGHCKAALDAIRRQDMGGLVYNFNWMHQRRVKLNLPVTLAEGVRRKQSEIAKLPRRPQLPKRAVRRAMIAGHRTAEDVDHYLQNNSHLEDAWGKFDIDYENGVFTLTDTDRDFVEKTLRAARILKLISELKKDFPD